MMKVLLSLLGVLFAINISAQQSVSDTTMSIPMFYLTYMYQFPGGDLADRYGNSSSVGGGFQWKTDKNWIIGTEYTYLFGQDVKIADEIMLNIKTEEGNIINMAGTYASYQTYQRGYYISARFGKLQPVLNPNPNSGFVFMGSLGYFTHKIRIEVADNSAPQLFDDYKKGYDRLAGGFGISEQVGYLYLSNSRIWNFFFGVEFNQAWTSPMRDVNFDTGLSDEVSKRFDSTIGIKLAWFIPIFKRLPQKYYYY